MSLTISTDVFCDGPDCSDWAPGVTGPRTDARGAREEAKRVGWQIRRHGDFCPVCAARDFITKHSGGEHVSEGNKMKWKIV